MAFKLNNYEDVIKGIRDSGGVYIAPDGYTYWGYYGQSQGGGMGDASTDNPNYVLPDIQSIDRFKTGEAKSSRMIEEFDLLGNPMGSRKDTYSNLAGDLLKFGAMAAGLHGIGGLMSGAMGGGAGAAAGGYGGTSMAGATGGLTPAALEASLGTAGYGAAGTAGGQFLGLDAALNGLGAAQGFGANALTPWAPGAEFGLEFINAAEPAIEQGLYQGTSMANAMNGMTPAAMEAALGTPGYGFNAAAAAANAAGLLPGVSPLLNGAGAASSFSSSPLDWLKSNVSPGMLQAGAGLLGGIAGSQGTPGGTQTNERKLDPRLDAAIFGANGQGGLLSRVLDFANNNPTGQNDTMRQASERQRMLLNDPRVLGGLSNIYGQSQGLLNQGVAPNPFANWKP